MISVILLSILFAFLTLKPTGQTSSRLPLLSDVTSAHHRELCSGCQPRQHVLYLKTHKTGSTTIYSILAEFCRARELLPLLPRDVHINLYAKFHASQLLLHKGVSQYDMLFNHMVFEPKVLNYLPNDTFKFTTLRDPLRQFISSFRFFSQYKDQSYLQNIPGPEPMITFLSDPKRYEAKGMRSLTNNRQSVDLGFDLRYSVNDTSYIIRFVKQVEENFDLVLITEYFDESLVLLKRLLGWSTCDILYFQKWKSAHQSDDVDPVLRKLHRHHSVADRCLYFHFLGVFKQVLSTQRDVPGEVEEFRSVLRQVGQFCDGHTGQRQLVIPAGRWTDRVAILKSKCEWLKLDEVSFTRHLQKTQLKRLAETPS